MPTSSIKITHSSTCVSFHLLHSLGKKGSNATITHEENCHKDKRRRSETNLLRKTVLCCSWCGPSWKPFFSSHPSFLLVKPLLIKFISYCLAALSTHIHSCTCVQVMKSLYCTSMGFYTLLFGFENIISETKTIKIRI